MGAHASLSFNFRNNFEYFFVLNWSQFYQFNKDDKINLIRTR